MFKALTCMDFIIGTIEALRRAYEDNLEDVDLFTGGLAEVRNLIFTRLGSL